MRTDFDRELEDRLVAYCAIDTQSDEGSETAPSTERQFVLLKRLVGELEAIGAGDVRLTDYGVVPDPADFAVSRKSSSPALLVRVQ